MSDTVKLVIEIPKKTIAHIRSNYGHGCKGLYDEDKEIIVDAIWNGSKEDNAMDIYSDLLRVKHGTMSIDSLIDKVWCKNCIGKADFPQAGDIEPTVENFIKVLDNKLISDAIRDCGTDIKGGE